MNHRSFGLWAMRKIDDKVKCEVNKAQRCYPVWTDDKCRECHKKAEDGKR